MRVVVLLLALIGAVGSGFLGYKWYSDSKSPEAKLAREMGDLAGKLDPGAGEKVKEATSELDKMIYASYLLMAGALLGIIGGVLAMNGKGLLAGLVLLIAPVGAGILAVKSLVFCGPLAVAGLLAFFIRPDPARA